MVNGELMGRGMSGLDLCFSSSTKDVFKEKLDFN